MTGNNLWVAYPIHRMLRAQSMGKWQLSLRRVSSHFEVAMGKKRGHVLSKLPLAKAYI